MSTPTQQHIPISNIREDLLFLKDGSMACVLQTSAVNFDLLSDNEQIAIIDSFAGLLNSLTFAIQIVIRSKKLDITDYLQRLSEKEEGQHNPLLKGLIQNYRTFIETLIKENEVLDKQFYIVIPLSYYEVGVLSNLEKDLPKALALLNPRRDAVIKQLARVGLKATQLTTERLIRLFYDVYNESETYGHATETLFQQEIKSSIKPIPATPPQVNPAQAVTTSTLTVDTPLPQTDTLPPRQLHQSTPFIVEELTDDYGTV